MLNETNGCNFFQDKKIAELELSQKDTGKLAQVMANFANLQSGENNGVRMKH